MLLEVLAGGALATYIVKNVGVDGLKKHFGDVKSQIVTSVNAGIADANAAKAANAKTQVLGSMFQEAFAKATPEKQAEMMKLMQSSQE